MPHSVDDPVVQIAGSNTQQRGVRALAAAAPTEHAVVAVNGLLSCEYSPSHGGDFARLHPVPPYGTCTVVST